MSFFFWFCFLNINERMSKFICTFAITYLYVFHTAFCSCVIIAVTVTVTWSKIELDRTSFLDAQTWPTGCRCAQKTEQSAVTPICREHATPSMICRRFSFTISRPFWILSSVIEADSSSATSSCVTVLQSLLNLSRESYTHVHISSHVPCCV